MSFEQVLTVVRQLPDAEKLKLSREMEKDVRNVVLTRLLKSFQTDEVDLDAIEAEVEAVRSELYAK